MNKNEIITISSDDDADITNQILDSNTVKIDCKNVIKQQKNSGVIVKNNEDDGSYKNGKDDDGGSNSSPEVVELVDFLDKLDKESSCEIDKNSELDIIQLDETSIKHEIKTEIDNEKLIPDMNKIKTDYSIPDSFNNLSKTDEESNQNLKFFTEFVEYCGSLEKIPNDRVKLTKKLMKRYGEADSSYIKSQEFRHLIDKCRHKINKNNLYLIAKEVTEELSYKKKIEVGRNKPNLKEEKNAQENSEEISDASLKLSKKRARFIDKIVKKLDKLGNKIRELEEETVNLSDEEESTYVLLQRYRERFCQIYKRLCAFTNQIPDPNNRKICFTESKYPAINKCIETWLNKTKKFPDFSDIMKLLESQSSSLGLPSNRESVRAIAVEIFQKVGVMLQRRRIYDLWDLFCGFLDDGKDPADDDPILNETLKSNFETRLKKEQEIFQHYAELQEKEKLEPEEVGDEEANHSPIESENEDDKEIEEIENNLNKKLDEAIENGEDIENKDYEENDNNSENETDTKVESIKISKETKNNYKNCKSLKWRQENSSKSKSDTSISEDSSTGTENEKEKSENDVKKDGSMKESVEIGKEDSDLELITVEENNDIKIKDTACKRASNFNIENITPKKKNRNDFDMFEIDEENEKKYNFFGVHCCQIFNDNIFSDIKKEKKDWEKRAFKDLTNVNKLMELHGKRKKNSVLFSPFFFHKNVYEKSYWKKRFKVRFRFVGLKNEKCALNQDEEKTNKIISGGDSDDKNYIENYTIGYENGDNNYKNNGNGSEGDNNEDENKKRIRDEINYNQLEIIKEDDDDDEEDNGDVENSSKGCSEEKTTPLDFVTCSYENYEDIESCNIMTVTPEYRVEVGTEEIVDVKKDNYTEDEKSIINTPTVCFLNKKESNIETVKKKIKSIKKNNNNQLDIRKRVKLDISSKETNKTNPLSPSDDERVKRFLMHSPSSVSITPPKILTYTNYTASNDVIQALKTIEGLKDVSATFIQTKSNTDDDDDDDDDDKKIIEDISTEKCMTTFPVISNVQSIATNSMLLNLQKSNRDPGTSEIANVWGDSSGTYVRIPKEMPNGKKERKKKIKKNR